MQNFSNLFDKVLYMFRTGPLTIIRSISTLYIAIGVCHASSVGCLLAWSGWKSSILTTLADSQQNWHDKYQLHVYSVGILLMMDSGPVRNI